VPNPSPMRGRHTLPSLLNSAGVCMMHADLHRAISEAERPLEFCSMAVHAKSCRRVAGDDAPA